MATRLASVQRMQLHDHAIYFYEAAADKHKTLFPFLQKGIAQGELAFYLVGDEPVARLRRSMGQGGLDVKTLEARGSLRIRSSRSWYQAAGRLKPPRAILAQWSKLCQRAVERGFKGVRVVAEVTGVVQTLGELRRFAAYERKVGVTLRIPMMAICVYDQRAIGARKLSRVITSLFHAHEFGIFPGAFLRFD